MHRKVGLRVSAQALAPDCLTGKSSQLLASSSLDTLCPAWPLGGTTVILLPEGLGINAGRVGS
jgi:hypothetical protein